MKSTLPDQGNKVPQVRISLNDVRALLSMLTGYLTYLRTAVPRSPRRETQIRTLEALENRAIFLEILLIHSQGSVRAVNVPPFLLQHSIEVLVPPLALQPHVLAKMPFAA